MVDPWATLGLAPTDDLRQIKKSYTARLKQTHPEDDPGAFQELRQAYELACELVRRRHPHGPGSPWFAPRPPASPPASTPSGRSAPQAPRALAGGAGLAAYEVEWAEEAAGQLMEQVQRLHDDASAWTSEGAWRALLQNQSLWNVDTRNAFQGRLLRFLALHGGNLNAPVWEILEGDCHWREQRWSLYRAHPPDLVDKVMDRLDYLAPIEAAERLWNEGLHHEAVAQLEGVVHAVRGELGVRARLLAGRCYLKTRAWAKAEAVLDDVVHSDPSCVDAYLLLATLYSSEGRPQPAKDMYLKVLALMPGHRGALAGLAQAERGLRDPYRVKPPPPETERPPERHDEPAGDPTPGVRYLWLLMMTMGLARSCSQDLEAPGLRPLLLGVAGLVLLCVPVAFWLRWRRRHDAPTTLGFSHDPRSEETLSSEARSGGAGGRRPS